MNPDSEWIDFDKEPWHVFMVYGAFKEPSKGVNFIIVRRKPGRCPWAKKIVPAIHRLVSQWKEHDWKGYDWDVDGEPSTRVGEKRLWDTRVAAKYEWDGTGLRLVTDTETV